nr:MAG TPA: hypothetical protein [Caudoviricetes sp.]
MTSIFVRVRKWRNRNGRLRNVCPHPPLRRHLPPPSGEGRERRKA